MPTFFERRSRRSFAAHESAFNDAIKILDANEVWKQVPPDADQRHNQEYQSGLKAPTKPEVSTDEALAGHLRPEASSPARRPKSTPYLGRLAQAIERAAKLLEPKVQTIPLERSTLRDAAEVEAWSERQKKTLMDAVANGPVLVS